VAEQHVSHLVALVVARPLCRRTAVCGANADFGARPDKHSCDGRLLRFVEYG